MEIKFPVFAGSGERNVAEVLTSLAGEKEDCLFLGSSCQYEYNGDLGYGIPQRQVKMGITKCNGRTSRRGHCKIIA
jgi:hypothetical protein